MKRIIIRNNFIAKSLSNTVLYIMVMTGAASAHLSNASFHRGGTGNCEGCHMTTSPTLDNNLDSSSSSMNNSFSLKGSDPSSTCLRCHEAPTADSQPMEYYISTNMAQMGTGVPPKQLTPGGDFGWLKKNYSWSGNERSYGDSHGHNIVASDYGYTANNRQTIAPGGTYSAEKLSCISCHDPHGNYRRTVSGNIDTSGPPISASGSYKSSPDPDPQNSVGTYRMLAGKGYQPKYFSGGGAFTADPPAAVSPDSYNREESVADTRVAYGSGMSEWCANCHTNIHNDNYPGKRIHPAGNFAKLTSEVIDNYNMYVGSGNLNGNSSTAYSSMVPYEMGTDDYALLKSTANNDGSNRSGASLNKGGPNVMCLTCHRAHASCWDGMSRWNMQADFIVYDGQFPGTDNGSPIMMAQGRTSAEVEKAYYGRPASSYATYQRSLCNKCHAKD
jgi:hypothetical protein